MKTTTKIFSHFYEIKEKRFKFIFSISYEGSKEMDFMSDLVLFGSMRFNEQDKDISEIDKDIISFWEDRNYTIRMTK
jgi:hypothetical protein